MARRLASDAQNKISLRTITWVEAVVRKSKKSISALEIEFQPDLPKGKSRKSRSLIWHKYKKGTVVPRSDTGLDGRDGLVVRVDRKYPGTAALFNSALWELCSDEPVEMRRIKEIYCALPLRLRKLFVVNAKAKFWRKPFDPNEVCEVLLRVPSLHGLVALICMAREAEVIQDPLQYEFALHTTVVRLESNGTDSKVLNETVRDTLVRKFRASHDALHQGASSPAAWRR